MNYDRKNKLLLVSKYKDIAGVYALLRNDEVFYIGISKKVGKRIHSHLVRRGFDCDFMLLEEMTIEGKYRILTREQLKREKYWINLFTSFGIKLENIIYLQKKLHNPN